KRYLQWAEGQLPPGTDRALNDAWWPIADRPVEVAPAQSRPAQDAARNHPRVLVRLRLFIADRATLEVCHHDLAIDQIVMAFRDGTGGRFRGGLGLHHDPRHHTSPVCGYAIGL